MAGLLRGCGSPGHSPAWGWVAVVPGGEQGCPSHCPNAQLNAPKPQSGAAAPRCPAARSSQRCPLPPACHDHWWLPLRPPASPTLEQPSSCSLSSPRSSPHQCASSALDVLQFPCLPPSWRAQSWPGAASSLPKGGGAHPPLRPAPHSDVVPQCLSAKL